MSVITDYLIQRMVDGKKTKAKRIVLTRTGRDTFNVAVCDKHGEVIANVSNRDLEVFEGAQLTIADIDKAFNIELNRGF